jgi:hypothetical protein
MLRPTNANRHHDTAHLIAVLADKELRGDSHTRVSTSLLFAAFVLATEKRS